MGFLSMSQDEVQKFIKMVEPARLANTTENAAALASYVKKHNLPHTAESCFQAVNALVFTEAFTSDVEPGALKGQRANANKPAKIEDPQKVEAARQAKLKAEQEKAKIDKEFAALVKQCEELIESYYPRKRSGSIDYPERDSSQAKWRASLAVAKQKNDLRVMRAYRDSLVATVNKRYQDQEKASERM
jgi:hypothetical protein